MSDPSRKNVDLDDPAELTTQADDVPALSRREAEVAGIVP